MSSDSPTFSSYRQPESLPRPWVSAFLGSSFVYLLLVLLLLGLSMFGRPPAVEKRVELTFVEKIVKPEPPPPEPATIELKPAEPQAPAPAAAPVVPMPLKIRKLDKPPPRKELLAPKEIPKDLPKEAEPLEDKGVAVYGDPGTGDPVGLEGGMNGGVAGGQVGVIDLPPDATAPKPLAGNSPPKYPESARRRGKSGKVMLKITIKADGSVGEMSVLSGDEPFVTAARDAVGRWHFEPARYQGQAIAVYRVIPITFNLED